MYVTFQSNEGDTPKNAYSFRGGQWLSPSRGAVLVSFMLPMAGPALGEFLMNSAETRPSIVARTVADLSLRFLCGLRCVCLGAAMCHAAATAPAASLRRSAPS